MGERVLIVNADDFGLSPGVNDGVARTHEQGIVTSASLMVRGQSAAEAAAYARGKPSLSVGLHFDLGEWEYRDGEWRLAYQVVPLDDQDATRAEASAQLDGFRTLMDREPTHLDSHQHLHVGNGAAEVLADLGRELEIPVRHLTQHVSYTGQFYGQSDKGYPHPEAITVSSLSELIASMPPGVTEIGCHPATAIDFDSVYSGERVTEVEVLCDPGLRDVLAREQIKLCSFAELNATRNAAR
jgi:chitin disaccharide deacetylase